MVTHSSILAWRIPWTEEPGKLQPMGSQRVGHNWNNLVCTHAYIRTHTYIRTHAFIHTHISISSLFHNLYVSVSYLTKNDWFYLLLDKNHWNIMERCCITHSINKTRAVLWIWTTWSPWSSIPSYVSYTVQICPSPHSAAHTLNCEDREIWNDRWQRCKFMKCPKCFCIIYLKLLTKWMLNIHKQYTW